MPWCDECSRWFSPNALSREGECPTCGTRIETPPEEEVLADRQTRIPWHLWLLLAALVMYLGWRLLQGVGWIAERF